MNIIIAVALAFFASLSSLQAQNDFVLHFSNETGGRCSVQMNISPPGSKEVERVWLFSNGLREDSVAIRSGSTYPVIVSLLGKGGDASSHKAYLYTVPSGAKEDRMILLAQADVKTTYEIKEVVYDEQYTVSGAMSEAEEEGGGLPLYPDEPSQIDSVVSFPDTLARAETARPETFPKGLEKKTWLVIRNFLPGPMEIHVGHGGIFDDRKESLIPSRRQSVLILEQGHDHNLRIKYTVGGRQSETRWTYRALRNVWTDTLNFGGPHKGFIHNLTSQLVLIMPAETSFGIKGQARRSFTEQDNEWVMTNYPQQDWDRIVSLYERSLRNGAILLYPGEHADVYRAAPQADSLAAYFGLRACTIAVDINVVPRDTPFNGVYYDWGAEIRPSAEIKAKRVRNSRDW